MPGSSANVQITALADRGPGYDKSHGDWQPTKLFHVTPGMTALPASAVADWGERDMAQPPCTRGSATTSTWEPRPIPAPARREAVLGDPVVMVANNGVVYAPDEQVRHGFTQVLEPRHDMDRADRGLGLAMGLQAAGSASPNEIRRLIAYATCSDVLVAASHDAGLVRDRRQAQQRHGATATRTVSSLANRTADQRRSTRRAASRHPARSTTRPSNRRRWQSLTSTVLAQSSPGDNFETSTTTGSPAKPHHGRLYTGASA